MIKMTVGNTCKKTVYLNLRIFSSSLLLVKHFSKEKLDWISYTNLPSSDFCILPVLFARRSKEKYCILYVFVSNPIVASLLFIAKSDLRPLVSQVHQFSSAQTRLLHFWMAEGQKFPLKIASYVNTLW